MTPKSYHLLICPQCRMEVSVLVSDSAPPIKAHCFICGYSWHPKPRTA